MPVPAECQPLQDEIDELLAERESWGQDLREPGVAGPVRHSILRIIRALMEQIEAKRELLDACLAQHGVAVPLTTAFNFTATLTTTDPRAPGPFVQQNLSATLRFSAERAGVDITSFPSIMSPPFMTPAGQNITTITMLGLGIGTFDAASGHTVLQVRLRFDHSIDVPFIVEDSDMNNLILGTMAAPGSPLNRQAKGLTLTGTGVFTGGILGGSMGTITLAGTLQDLP